MEAIKKQIEQIATDCVMGELNAIEAGRKLYALEKFIKEQKIVIQEDLNDELAKYEKQELKEMKIEVRQGGRIWNFKEIKEWNEAKKSVTSIEGRAKIAWEASQKGLESIDENGEISTLPTVTYKSSSIIFK